MSEERGLAAHVRSRENHELLGGAVERDVIGHKRGGDVALHHRMACIKRRKFIPVVHMRLGVVAGRRGVSQRGQCVERSHGAGGIQNAWGLCGHPRTQRLKQREFPHGEPLVGVQHLVLKLLERGRDVPFAAGDGLLPDVVVRRVGEIRLGDLDVVPEHPVITNLERRDACACALSLFHRGDGGFTAATDAAQFVHFGVRAVANDAAVTRDRRRFVHEGVFDQVAEVHEVIKFGQQAEHERRLQRGHQAA